MPQEPLTPWLEMMEEIRATMQTEENTTRDPISVLKHWYDASAGKWSKAFGDAIGTEQFAEAMSSILENYMSFSGIFRQASEVYFRNLQLPTRSDIARLAGLVVNLEEKVDRIEDSLEQSGNDSVQGSAGASLQRLEARLGEVEGRIEKVLAVLEKMEIRERLGADSGPGMSQKAAEDQSIPWNTRSETERRRASELETKEG